MTAFIPSGPRTSGAWSEARSALPDAPVILDEPARLRRRVRLGAALRALARRQLALAERLDPAHTRPHRCEHPAGTG